MNDTPQPRRRLTVTTAALLIAFAALVVTLVVAGVAIRATGAAEKAQDAADLIIEQRTESRRVACETDNSNAAAFRLKAETTALGFEQFAALLIGDRPIEGDLADSYAVFEETVIDPQRDLADPGGPFADRDCSPEGIEAFYEGTKP